MFSGYSSAKFNSFPVNIPVNNFPFFIFLFISRKQVHMQVRITEMSVGNIIEIILLHFFSAEIIKFIKLFVRNRHVRTKLVNFVMSKVISNLQGNFISE